MSGLVGILNSNSPGVVVFTLGTDGNSSVTPLTDGLSSPVEDEPLLSIVRIGVSESDVVSRTITVGDVSYSLGTHGGLDLELDTVFQWVTWEFNALSVEVPGLGGTIIAHIEGHVSVVAIVLTPWFKTVSTDVSNISDITAEVLNLLVTIVDPWSDDNRVAHSVLITKLVTNGVVLL